MFQNQEGFEGGHRERIEKKPKSYIVMDKENHQITTSILKIYFSCFFSSSRELYLQ